MKSMRVGGPTVKSERTVHAGDVVAIGGLVKVKHRCGTCGTVFVLVRETVI